MTTLKRCSNRACGLASRSADSISMDVRHHRLRAWSAGRLLLRPGETRSELGARRPAARELRAGALVVAWPRGRERAGQALSVDGRGEGTDVGRAGFPERDAPANARAAGRTPPVVKKSRAGAEIAIRIDERQRSGHDWASVRVPDLEINVLVPGCSALRVICTEAQQPPNLKPEPVSAAPPSGSVVNVK